MKKAKTYRKELQFEINGNSVETLDNIDEETRKEFGLFGFEAAGVKGFSGGIPLSSNEYEGEGLPTEKDSRAHHIELNLNIDLRFSHDGNGNIELLIAKKGSGRHFKFPVLKGLTPLQAEFALVEFEQKMIFSVIPRILNYTAWACYRKQDNNVKKRKESFNKIIANLESHFRNILNRKGEKIVDKIEKDGYKITTYKVIESGRNKGTKKPRQLSKKEIENRNSRKQKILEAMREAIDSENKSELAHIVGISRPTLNNWLKSIGVKTKQDFHYLIRFAESVK